MNEPFNDKLRKRHGIAPRADITLDPSPDPPETSGSSSARIEKLVAHAPKKTRYAFHGELARGGMGAILQVWDEDLRRTLAMKVVLGQGEEDSVEETPTGVATPTIDPKTLHRFVEEAQVTGQLNHPGVVPVHELGIDPTGRVYFTMQLVRGRPFKDVIELAREGKEGWTQTRALEVVVRVCDTVAYSHSKDVIHRDIKPSNIMVGRYGEVYLMDWGVAKILDGQAPEETKHSPEASLSQVLTDRKDEIAEDPEALLVTADGGLVGTPCYMPPEQADHQSEVGPHSDIYSLGATLYTLLTGRMPYVPPNRTPSPHTVVHALLNGPPQPVTEIDSHNPPELVAICEKAMDRNPGRRYATAQEMAEDLRAFLENRVVRAYRTGAVAEFSKWVGRNRGMAAAIAAAILVALGGLTAVAGIQIRSNRDLLKLNDELVASNREAKEARDDAVENESRARSSEQRAREQEAYAQEQARLAQANAERAKEQEQAARDQAELARKQEQIAIEQERRARASEETAIRQSYVANLAAAAASLRTGSSSHAKRHLAKCVENLRGWEWSFLNRRSDSSLEILEGHESLIWSLAFSADGKLLASGSGSIFGWGSADSSVRIWDTETWETVQVLEGHQNRVTTLAFSSDRSLLASGGATGELLIWDLEAAKQTRRRRVYNSDIAGAAFLEETSQLLVALRNGRVLMVDPLAEKADRQVLELEFEISCMDLSPDGNEAAFASNEDYRIKIVSIPTFEIDKTLRRDFGSRINCIDYRFDDKRLIAGTDQNLSVWDLENETILSTVSNPSNAARYSPNGLWAVTGGDSILRFCDPEKGHLLDGLNGHDWGISSIAYSPDGRRIATASVDETVRIWDGQPGSAVSILPASGLPGPEYIAMSYDGTKLAFRPHRESVRVIDARSGDPLYTLPTQTVPIIDLRFSPNDTRLYTASRDGIRVWNAETGAPIPFDSRPFVSAQTVYLGPRCELMAIVGNRRFENGFPIWIRRVHTGELVHTLWSLNPKFRHAAFSPDSKRIATAHSEAIHIWDLETGEILVTIESGKENNFLAFSPDGTMLSSTVWGPDYHLYLWDTETSSLLRSFECPSPPLVSLFLPHGSRIVTGNGDGSTTLFDLAGDELANFVRLRSSTSPIHSLTVSSDGSRLVARATDHLRIWQTTPAEELTAVKRGSALISPRVLEATSLVDSLRADLPVPTLRRVIRHLEREPQLDEDLRKVALQIARTQGEDPDALRTLCETLAHDPERPDSDYARAVEIAREIAPMRPSDCEAPGLQGAAHYRLGEFQEALDALTRSEELHGDHTGTLYMELQCYLAMTWARLEDPDRAGSYLRKARRELRAERQQSASSERIESWLTLLREAETVLTETEE